MLPEPKRPLYGACAVNAAKTTCPMGHQYAGYNLMRRPTGGRRCRTCHNAARAARRFRRGY